MDAPDSTDGYRGDLKRALEQMAELRPGHIKGKEYYDGTRAEVAASRVVESIIAKSAQAHPISLAHIPVDTVANKVELASLTASEAPAASILEEVIDSNDLEDEVDDWLTKACYFGDYYAIVDPTEEDGDSGTPTPEGLRIVGSSPLTTIVVYDRKDERTALYGAKRWKGKGKRWHALLYYDDATIKLITAPGLDAANAEDFEPDYGDGDPGDERIEHPGGRMLIEHFAVGGRPYGVPVHVRAYGPQDAITKISATNLVNVDGQGFASRWALADPLAEIDDDIDDDFGTDAGPGAAKPDGQTTMTTGTSRVRSLPGAIALLRGVKQVGTFEQTETEHFLKNLDWYVRVMAVATGTPLFEFDLNGEQPSGESRRRAEGRVNRKARKVQRAAAAFLKNLGDTVLAVLGTRGSVSVTFAPLETSTDKEGLELVSAKVKAGVPVRVALLEAGYTEEQVGEWWPEDEPAVTYDVLVVLATALQQLGQAKTLGVITDTELADMLPTILTGARAEGLLDDEPDEVLPGVVQPARPASIEA